MAGKMDKAKGAIKEAAGRATGNERLEAEGKTEKAKGHVKEGVRDVKEGAKGVRDSLRAK